MAQSWDGQEAGDGRLNSAGSWNGVASLLIKREKKILISIG